MMSTSIAVVIQIPDAELRISANDVSDYAIRRMRQLSELLLLIQPDEGPSNMLFLCQQMADELVVAVEGMAGVRQ
jgi:hypothetical protein